MGSPKANNIRQLVTDLHLNGKSNLEIFRTLLGSVSERTIRRWIQQFKETGKTTNSVSTGRPRSASNHLSKKKVKRLVRTHSIRQISRKLSISYGSFFNIIKELKLKPFKLRKIPLLTNEHIRKRLRFAQLWRKTKKFRFKNFPIMFSDEKIFTVDGGLNKQNQRIYALTRQEADRKGGIFGVMKKPISVMVWIGMTEFGLTRPYFIKEGETIDSVYYKRRILPFAKREGNRLCGTNKWVFQQDGAKPHTAKISQNFCRRNLHLFIEKDIWPPNSPDLNPCDFFLWNSIVLRMNVEKFASRQELIDEIKAAVDKVPLEEIKQAVLSFTSRVRQVEKSKGNYCHK